MSFPYNIRDDNLRISMSIGWYIALYEAIYGYDHIPTVKKSADDTMKHIQLLLQRFRINGESISFREDMFIPKNLLDNVLTFCVTDLVAHTGLLLGIAGCRFWGADTIHETNRKYLRDMAEKPIDQIDPRIVSNTLGLKNKLKETKVTDLVLVLQIALPFLYPSTNNNSSSQPTHFRGVVVTENQWRELCSILDEATSWKKLGAALQESPSRMERLELAFTHDPDFSPSKALLKEWQYTSEATAQAFLNILKEIENQTAVLLFSTWQSNK